MEYKVQNQGDPGKAAFTQLILDIEVDKPKTVNGSAKHNKKYVFYFQFFQFSQAPFLNINFCIIVEIMYFDNIISFLYD